MEDCLELSHFIMILVRQDQPAECKHRLRLHRMCDQGQLTSSGNVFQLVSCFGNGHHPREQSWGLHGIIHGEVLSKNGLCLFIHFSLVFIAYIYTHQQMKQTWPLLQEVYRNRGECYVTSSHSPLLMAIKTSLGKQEKNISFP